jgi:uncharacterized protein YlxW (UPF0749 family)
MTILILLVTAILIVLYRRTEKTMIDIKGLIAKVDALTAIVPNIKADYESLSATVAELQAKVASMEGVDPELQALIDSLDAKLGASLVTLKSLDESVPGAAAPVAEAAPAENPAE